MIERFIDDIVLKAKSATGASEEALIWLLAGSFFAVIAAVFLSVAAYAWLAGIYGAPLAALIVGAAHCVLAAAIVTRCVSVRRRNRALALAQLELAASKQHEGWKLDPTYLAIGIEIVKIVGIRNIVPLVVGGFAAAGLAGSRNGKAPGHTTQR
jgi:hypothetical protein